MSKKLVKLHDILYVARRSSYDFGIRFSTVYLLKNLIFRKNRGAGKKFHFLQYEILKEQLRKNLAYKKVANENAQYEFKDNKIIWLIWWQGITTDTPVIIRNNINQLKKTNSDWNIKVVDKENYINYIEIPKRILSLFSDGKISVTHLSDYVRVALLERVESKSRSEK